MTARARITLICLAAALVVNVAHLLWTVLS